MEILFAISDPKLRLAIGRVIGSDDKPERFAIGDKAFALSHMQRKHVDVIVIDEASDSMRAVEVVEAADELGMPPVKVYLYRNRASLDLMFYQHTICLRDVTDIDKLVATILRLGSGITV